MNEMQTSAIKWIRVKIAKLERIAQAIESLPDDLPVTNLYESCEDICMSVPYDPKRIAKVRAALGPSWKVADKPHTMNDGDWIVEYHKVDDREIKIVLFGHILAPGATCRRVKAGTKTVDVYKIVCDEAVK